jgi:hypothetical protein
VWIDFCTISLENARRFYEDAIRDIFGWSNAISNLYESGLGEKHVPLSGAIGRLESFAAKEGISPLKDDFKRVRDVAREMDRETDFTSLFKLYSKFAHPTAWIVRTVRSIDADEGLRDMFFADGARLAVSALSRISNSIVSLFPNNG